MANNPPNQRIIDELNYWGNLVPIWEAAPAANIGLAAGDITKIKAALSAARAKYDAAQTARKLAKDATTAQTEALQALRTLGRADTNTIKSFIIQSGNSKLWSTAGLTPPATPGTVPNPNAPFDITGSLDGQGNLTLKWKSSQPANASGTVYNIYRGLNNDAPTLLDTVGPRTFVDETIPVGTTKVTYYLKAKRSGKSSAPSQNLLLQFGRAANGQTMITGVKLAA